MAGLGRVLVGGKDRGAGFALGPRLVVTANHVVRDRGDKPVVYVPAGGEAVEVERVQPDAAHDAAILWLAGDVGVLAHFHGGAGGGVAGGVAAAGRERPAVARDGHARPG